MRDTISEEFKRKLASSIFRFVVTSILAACVGYSSPAMQVVHPPVQLPVPLQNAAAESTGI